MKLHSDHVRFGAAVFVLAGILCNEWMVAFVLSASGLLERSTVFLIRVFQAYTIVSGIALWRFRRRPNLVALVFGTVIVFVTTGALEGIFSVLNNSKPAPVFASYSSEDGSPVDYFMFDMQLGTRPPAEGRFAAIKKQGEQVVYDVVYTTDRHRRRFTPTGKSPRSKYALFFGGSITFGEGVNDDETLPYHFGQLKPEHRPYNFGFHGYGPQQMLATLESKELMAGIEEESGVLFYSYIRAHLDRAIGSSVVYNGWGRNYPYYAFDEDGRLERLGDFATGRPTISLLYELLGRSQIAKYFDVELPFRQERHYVLTARIIERSERLFLRMNPANQFYVILYPGPKDAVSEYLKGVGVNVIDYTELLDFTSPGYIIEGDGHPSREAHLETAEQLGKDVTRMESRSRTAGSPR